MREHRSPNPLVDSRRPKNGSEADLNPPGFVWRPVPNATHYELRIGKSPGLTARSSKSYEVCGRTLYLLPESLKPGVYHWRWRALGCGQDKKWSETFSFTVTPETPHLVIPPGREVVARIAPGHPRHMLPASRLDAFRARCRDGLRAEWERLRAQAEERLRENFWMTEPPFLPSRATDHDTWGRLWRDAMNHSRQMATDAQNFGLVYLISGEERFGRAAVERLLEFAKWDPDGSTSIPHNDEPHMSIINWAQRAYDWAYGATADAERDAVREAFRQRGIRTHQLLVRQDYGVLGSSSHSGRMLGFLGELAVVFAGELREAEDWFDFVLPTTAAMYPWWGGRDGGWAEGVSYSTGYCERFLNFLFGLREATGIDLYQKPFFRRQGEWRLMCIPPNARLLPFGDGRTGGRGLVRGNYGIQFHLGHIHGDGRFLEHAEQIAKSGDNPPVTPLTFLTPPGKVVTQGLPKSAAQLFRDIGWLSIRTNLRNPDEDVRFTMRSSPYGATSHSHADHNSFVLEAFGEPLAIPSGLYSLYSSAHHHGWTRQTRAHNAVTFDGAGQIVRSNDAVGRFTAFHTDPTLTYAVGDATAAYGDRVRRCARAILCLDNRFFALVDCLEPSHEAMWGWHLHTAKPMQVDARGRRVLIRYDRAALDVVFCHRDGLHFRQHEGFDFQPFGYGPGEQPIPEEAALHHLDVHAEMPRRMDYLLTVLFPRKVADTPPVITPLLDGAGEGARIEVDGRRYRLFIRRNAEAIDLDGCRSDAEIVALFEDGAGRLLRAVRVGGTSLSLNGQPVAPEVTTVIG
ncbi:MAG: hypothetical protein A3F84_27505 [Candidatus Handelsmanbacteria bacterium RIFCSPLOWO2_12_FULL_64_10]|uniref:Uncharacterized protein n=1 Tax=Handelsmanbacteria sp. (strain RIFCSPLOWO2_12_FULL_64_10) TaxID=1817868 RepID=A0A1F6C3Q8_HANXR|nr:MAG: hypothetical protein A3F84_27505 [Candidatus Handelsmanbacteria bacterium RIFCSPLOWO2_12_FULL_64_10]